MDTNHLIVLLFATILSGSLFMIFSFGRLAVAELADRRAAGETLLKQIRRNPFFIFNIAFLLLALSLTGISSNRVFDGLAGKNIAGSWPEALAIFLAMLAAAVVLFHWAGTLGAARWPWRLFVIVTAVADIWLSLWLLALHP